LSKSLLENVEKSFDPVTVDVGLNENNEICIRFYPDLMGMYKVNGILHHTMLRLVVRHL
jgi:hypothetical protein